MTKMLFKSCKNIRWSSKIVFTMLHNSLWRHILCSVRTAFLFKNRKVPKLLFIVRWLLYWFWLLCGVFATLDSKSTQGLHCNFTLLFVLQYSSGQQKRHQIPYSIVNHLLVTYGSHCLQHSLSVWHLCHIVN